MRTGAGSAFRRTGVRERRDPGERSSTGTRAAPRPAVEAQRPRALDEYGIPGSPAPPDPGRAVGSARRLCDVPAAVVDIIGAEEHHRIAAIVPDPVGCARDVSMCAHLPGGPAPVIPGDAALDPRFAEHPFGTGAIARVRFRASSRLRGPRGHRRDPADPFPRAPADGRTGPGRSTGPTCEDRQVVMGWDRGRGRPAGRRRSATPGCPDPGAAGDGAAPGRGAGDEEVSRRIPMANRWRPRPHGFRRGRRRRGP
ncbi:hypothetical protein GCM10027160_01910 [Streptomyces calidiresistens]